MPVRCPSCNKQYNRKKDLHKHILIHSVDKVYSCEICDEKFIREEDLSRHSVRHPKPLEPCDICNREFRTRHDLEVHLRTHTGEKPYVCDICDKRFSNAYNLSRHKLLHSCNRNYSCDFCTRYFLQECDLQKHLLAHKEKHSILCFLCDKAFASETLLNRHLLSHSGEKPEICAICNKSFSQKGSLERHYYTHIGKQFFCDICDRSFTQKSQLAQHSRIHKTQEFPICNLCLTPCVDKMDLLKHKCVGKNTVDSITVYPAPMLHELILSEVEIPLVDSSELSADVEAPELSGKTKEHINTNNISTVGIFPGNTDQYRDNSEEINNLSVENHPETQNESCICSATQIIEAPISNELAETDTILETISGIDNADNSFMEKEIPFLGTLMDTRISPLKKSIENSENPFRTEISLVNLVDSANFLTELQQTSNEFFDEMEIPSTEYFSDLETPCIDFAEIEIPNNIGDDDEKAFDIFFM